MGKFYLEIPSIERKEEAILYINEFYEFKSAINGVGSLHKYLDNYEEWLNKLQEDYNQIPNEDRVPSRTYFLIRNTDNKIIGMINIRLTLNENLKKHGGHIGYSIRPSERKKGYNKINLYLGLKVCQKYGIEKVLLDANKNNIASWKTMEDLGGVFINEFIDDGNIMKRYEINVNESINNNSSIYEKIVSFNKNTI